MGSCLISERLARKQEALLLGVSVGGFVYESQETGECCTDEDKVLDWIANGIDVRVRGYYTFEWNGSGLDEVWHL